MKYNKLDGVIGTKKKRD